MAGGDAMAATKDSSGGAGAGHWLATIWIVRAGPGAQIRTPRMNAVSARQTPARCIGSAPFGDSFCCASLSATNAALMVQSDMHGVIEFVRYRQRDR
jgi:hypothetical protein